MTKPHVCTKGSAYECVKKQRNVTVKLITTVSITLKRRYTTHK